VSPRLGQGDGAACRASSRRRGHDRTDVTVRRFVEVDDGLILLQIARNAFDMGANGNLDAPITVIMDTFDAISKAAPAKSGPTSGQDVADGLKKTVDFLDDSQDGVTAIFNRIKARYPK